MHHDDEIDLIELFASLWDGKWAIVSATLIALCVGGAYSVFKERTHIVSHQSTIGFSVRNFPPLHDANDANEIFFDFRELFHAKAEFEAWRARNSEAKIDFSDISLTKVVDGVELASNPKLVSLEGDGLKVNTNDLQVLDSFHRYLGSLNETLTRQYIVRTQADVKYIEQRFKELWSSDDALQDQVLNLLRHAKEVRTLNYYVDRAETGAANVLEIRRPTPPIVTSTAPKTNLMLALSVLLGGFFGAAYVLVRNAFRRRGEAVPPIQERL